MWTLIEHVTTTHVASRSATRSTDITEHHRRTVACRDGGGRQPGKTRTHDRYIGID
jgi:hypothetical protein